MTHPRDKRAGGRASHANFVGIERTVMDSVAFVSLSKLARALYLDLRRQFNGHNNGDITIADSVLSRYGWSHSSVHKALKEIVEHRLMIRSRKGGVTAPTAVRPSLYAFCDLPVMANPAKGIAGAQPMLSYRQFKPDDRTQQRKPRVHHVDGSVHRVDEMVRLHDTRG